MPADDLAEGGRVAVDGALDEDAIGNIARWRVDDALPPVQPPGSACWR
jgi:hypothetical protein